MRKVILMVVLTGVSGSAVAEWLAVDENKIRTTYANQATIRKKGNIVEMWELRDFKSVQAEVEGESYRSIMIQKEYDCKKGQYRIPTYSYHSESMGEGKIVDAGSKPGGWRVVTPGSVVEALWKLACGK